MVPQTCTSTSGIFAVHSGYVSGKSRVLILREQFGVIILRTIFLFIGVAACCIAAIRGRDAGRILVGRHSLRDTPLATCFRDPAR